MSGTRAGTLAPMARTVPTEVVNHKSMVPEPG